MTFKLPENVQETSTTTGTVTLSLAGAVSGGYPFSSQMANGDTTFYVMSDGVDIEVGVGTYTNTSGQQLSRDSVFYSTNGNARVDWAAGTRDVFAGLPGNALASMLDPAAGNGLIAQIADRTYARRQIGVDPDDLAGVYLDGVSGDPTLSLAFTVTAFIKTLLDDTDADEARSTLGSTTIGDSLFTCDTEETARGLIGVSPSHGQCRLIKSGSNLLLQPFNGNKIIINGSHYSVPSAGVSLPPSGLSPNTTYYIYAYMSGSTMTLEASTTVHARDTSTGVQIKTSAATRTLVGMARVVSGPSFEDSEGRRLVRSWFNDRGVSGRKVISSNENTASTSYAALNINTMRSEFLAWSGEHVDASYSGVVSINNDNTDVYTAIYIDGAQMPGGFAKHNRATLSVLSESTHHVSSQDTPSEGYHYLDVYGKVTAGTGTWLGGASPERGILKFNVSD